MLYVAMVAFFLLMGKMISDMSHDESETQAERNFYRSEYTVPYVSDL